MKHDAEHLITLLGLRPHPEGGAFREVHRGELQIDLGSRGPRAAHTAIYFLLRSGEFSAFHRVASDEVWHHYDGGPLDLHLLTEGGVASQVRLGHDFAAGERPLHVVPAGVWQAAAPASGPYALCGCTVVPGFDFVDFELPSRDELVARFPAHAGLIERFTRGPA